MALSTDKKLYIALGVLVVLGGILYVQRQRATEEQATYTLEGRTAELPEIKISEEQIKKIDKVVIEQPAGDAGKPERVVLAKKGEEDWKLQEPLEATANSSNVKSLLENLKKLEVSERIDPSKDAYGQYDLTKDKAVVATFNAGDEEVAKLYFGEGGSRGQMTRIAGKDGVYAVNGYSSFLYTRDLKGWRDMKLFEFDAEKVAKVEIDNEHGSFVFEREESEEKTSEDKDAGTDEKDNWSGKFKKAKSPVATKIKEFDPSKVSDMVRAYKSLSATDFERDKSAEEAGLAEPQSLVTFTLKDGAKRVLKVGKTAEGSNRYVQTKEGGEIFVISSWAADWATAEPEKFHESEEPEETSPPPGMPPGGQPMLGMPPGHP